MAKKQSKTKRRSAQQTRLAKSYRRSKSSRGFWFIPWPAAIFILLCIGVLLVGWTILAVADEISVKAKISAPFLTEPAIITNPSDGQHFSSIPITVSGTCPDKSYVNIYSNNIFAGSVLCSSSGAFQLQMDLAPGANTLVAQDYNLTDDAGPSSPSITVYYDAPKLSYPPFILDSKFVLTGFEVNQLATWKLQTTGGLAPYTFSVDWGDGTTSAYHQSSAGELEISHRYSSASSQGGFYTIKVNGQDSSGQSAFLQFFILIKNPTTGPLIGGSSGGNITKNAPKAIIPPSHWLLVAWPAYLVIVLMSVSYWLGEKEELLVLVRRGFSPGHRR